MLQMQDSTLLTQNARYITTAQQDSATSIAKSLPLHCCTTPQQDFTLQFQILCTTRFRDPKQDSARKILKFNESHFLAFRKTCFFIFV